MEHLFETAAQVAGLAGISALVFYYLFRDVIRKLVLPKLSKDQAYKTIRLILVLVFLLSLTGIIAWVYLQIPNPNLVLKGAHKLTIEERLLTNLVRIRYGEAPTDLESTASIEALNLSTILKSIKVGFRADYVLPICLESINGLRNPIDYQFFALADLFYQLQQAGVIRISVEEKNDAIGFLVLDKTRTKYDKNLRDKVNLLEGLLWPNCPRQEIESAYLNSCASPHCHESPQHSFSFPMDNLDLKIDAAVSAGQCWLGKMERSEREAGESFIKHSFSRYENFRIVGGNQRPPSDPYCENIIMEVRSKFQILKIFSRFINIPPEHGTMTYHNNKQLMAYYNRDMNLAKLVILCAKTRPEGASVSIKYRDFWFYIDDNDFLSKNTFSSLVEILGAFRTDADK